MKTPKTIKELRKALLEMVKWFGGMADGLVDDGCREAVDNARKVLDATAAKKK